MLHTHTRSLALLFQEDKYHHEHANMHQQQHHHNILLQKSKEPTIFLSLAN